MPEFEGTSETLNLQAALEDAIRKAYTASERRTHTDPLSGYVVKRISGHLRTLTVVIETATVARAAEPASQASPSSATGADPIKQLLDKRRRNEPLTANEQALIELLEQGPGSDPHRSV